MADFDSALLRHEQAASVASIREDSLEDAEESYKNVLRSIDLAMEEMPDDKDYSVRRKIALMNAVKEIAELRLERFRAACEKAKQERDAAYAEFRGAVAQDIRTDREIWEEVYGVIGVEGMRYLGQSDAPTGG